MDQKIDLLVMIRRQNLEIVGQILDLASPTTFHDLKNKNYRIQRRDRHLLSRTYLRLTTNICYQKADGQVFYRRSYKSWKYKHLSNVKIYRRNLASVSCAKEGSVLYKAALLLHAMMRCLYF